MRYELPHEDLTMMVWTDGVEELQRIAVMSLDRNETSAEHLAINAR